MIVRFSAATVAELRPILEDLEQSAMSAKKECVEGNARSMTYMDLDNIKLKLVMALEVMKQSYDSDEAACSKE